MFPQSTKQKVLPNNQKDFKKGLKKKKKSNSPNSPQVGGNQNKKYFGGQKKFNHFIKFLESGTKTLVCNSCARNY